MSRILVIDDEKSMREFLKLMLTRDGYDVESVATGPEAMQLIKRRHFDLIITDIRMQPWDGITVLNKIKEYAPEAMVVMISAYAKKEDAVEAMKLGAFDFLPKPFPIDEMRKVVSEALKQSIKSKGAKEGKEAIGKTDSPVLHFGLLVGESPPMYKIYDLIERVAKANSNVLISGESGTGKELVAKAIHMQSERKDKTFVTINCGGIPETLIESELFGYRKGAFTGAIASKKGLFEIANGGTIFLDEIGDLSPTMQVKLLRVIQDRTFIPLGETIPQKVDVRLISATNKDLEAEVMANRFREDLFFRLNVIHINIPPLRERGNDVELLTKYFLKKYSKEMNKDVQGISNYALEILKEYNFPGNVRELENIIERSVALETSKIILPESLTLSSFKKKEPLNGSSLTKLPKEGIDLDSHIAFIEKELILQAVERANGSRIRAASLLGITPRSLRYRLKKYGLEDNNHV